MRPNAAPRGANLKPSRARALVVEPSTPAPLVHPDLVFVCGTNTLGIHGAGSALYARLHYGLEPGVAEGPSGRAYALPTKLTPRQPMGFGRVAGHVSKFLVHARRNPGTRFLVTRVGCDRAGFSDKQMGALFRHAPTNCVLPVQWRAHVDARERRWHDEGVLLPETRLPSS